MIDLRLSAHARTLATRELAAGLRSQLDAEVAAGGRVLLDFGGIEAISHSFADELVAALAAAAIGSDAQVCVANASDDVQRVIVRAVERREATAALQLPALL